MKLVEVLNSQLLATLSYENNVWYCMGKADSTTSVFNKYKTGYDGAISIIKSLKYAVQTGKYGTPSIKTSFMYITAEASLTDLINEQVLLTRLPDQSDPVLIQHMRDLDQVINELTKYLDLLL